MSRCQVKTVDPDYHTATWIRTVFGQGDRMRNERFSTPEDIERKDDLVYGEDKTWNLCDVYYKKGTDTPQPTIINIHGGGFVYGSKEVYQYYGMDLAERGFTVVNFSYKLPPENPYPSTLYDINDLFCWVERHADEYYIDRENIFVVGDSAGAQMNSQYMVILTNPEYRKMFDMKIPEKLKVRATGLNCGLYDMRDFIEKASPPDGTVHNYFGGKCKPEYLEQLSVVKYITKDFPPAFIATSYYDHLEMMAEPLHELLDSLGVENVCREYGGKDQETVGHVFHIDIDTEEAEKCNREETDFFKKHIKK